MRRVRGLELLPLDLEIERTLRGIRRERRNQARAMGDHNNNNNNVEQQRAIRDYFKPPTQEHYSGIRRQTINANNFELKPSLISMVQQNQFGGLSNEDPNTHLSMFLEAADTVKINGVTEGTIRLKLFPFSLRDRARQWLMSLPTGSIGTWEEMTERFLTKFFPPSKASQLRSEIGSFRQNDFEQLYEAWERFKDLLRRCP